VSAAVARHHLLLHLCHLGRVLSCPSCSYAKPWLAAEFPSSKCGASTSKPIPEHTQSWLHKTAHRAASWSTQHINHVSGTVPVRHQHSGASGFPHSCSRLPNGDSSSMRTTAACQLPPPARTCCSKASSKFQEQLAAASGCQHPSAAAVTRACSHLSDSATARVCDLSTSCSAAASWMS